MRSEARLLTDPADISAVFPSPPPPVITVERVKREVWTTYGFARYHYLTRRLTPCLISCLLFRINGDPMGFVALGPTLTLNGPRRAGLLSRRRVILPDFEGLGYGQRIADYAADLVASRAAPRLAYLSSCTALECIARSYRREPSRWFSTHPRGEYKRLSSSFLPTRRRREDLSLIAFRSPIFKRRSFHFFCIGAPRFDRAYAVRLIGSQAEVAALTASEGS